MNFTITESEIAQREHDKKHGLGVFKRREPWDASESKDNAEAVKREKRAHSQNAANPHPLQPKSKLIGCEGRVLVLTLDLPPSINKTYHNVAGVGRVLSKNARAYKKETLAMCFLESLSGRGFRFDPDSRFGLDLVVTFGKSSKRRDLDNILKIVQDCVAKGVGFNDKQIDDVRVRRNTTVPSPPGVDVTLRILN